MGSVVADRGLRPGVDPGEGLHGRVQSCLMLHLSLISANMVLGRACSRCGIVPRTIDIGHLPRLVGAIEPLLGAYLSRFEIRETLQGLRALQITRDQDGADSPAVQGQQRCVKVLYEEDIDTARSEALQVCREMGLGHVDAVKVATVVSELARNICQYATQGTITLVPLERPRPGIRVIAEDEGPGIPHLDEVVSGRWRSKTGMGLGLLGSKRLMSTFDIQSDPGRGTRVTTEKYF